MKYITLVFSGLMQSWGGQNLADYNAESPRYSESSPTKSAIFGMLRSALGVERGTDDTYILENLEIINRIDCSGVLVRDYTIAQRSHHGFFAGTTKEIPRYHLQDAIFITLIRHPDSVIQEQIKKALRSPVWAPFLGRRAYVPNLPIFLGEFDFNDPKTELNTLPVFWKPNEPKTKNVQIISNQIGTENMNSFEYYDSPLDWDMKKRSYGATQYSSEFYLAQKPDQLDSSLFKQLLQIKESFQRNVH